MEMRRHWSSVRSDLSRLYLGTTIITNSEEISSAESLVRDAKDQTWHLKNSHDFQEQVIRTEIIHVPTGEFLRLDFKVPLKARTRLGALSEWHSIRATNKMPDAVITVETRMVSRTARESEWNNPELSADWRSDVRMSLSTLFLDSVERMRETLFAHGSDFDSIETLAQLVSHRPACDTPSRYSKLLEEWPDCDFDKDMGRPCTKKQLERVERAFKKGVLLPLY